MRYSLTFALLALTTTTVHSTTLFEGLAAANCTAFLSFIQSSPDLVALYTTTPIKTIFCPQNSAVEHYVAAQAGATASNATLGRRAVQKIPKQASAQTSADVVASGQLGTPPAPPVPVNNPAGPGTGDPGPAPPPRMGRSLEGRQATTGVNRSQVVISHAATGNNYRRQAEGSEATVPHPVHLFSGLGNNVTVLRTDVPWDGGLIHVCSGFFTLPQSFPDTLAHTGQSAFSTALSAANLTSAFDIPAGITLFSVPDATLAATNSSQLTPSVLATHIVPNFLGYLPLLTDGLVLTTSAGTTLKVTVKGGYTYINEARIVNADLIADNGVAHVLDRVLSPPVVAFTGAATVGAQRPGWAGTVAAGLVALGLAMVV